VAVTWKKLAFESDVVLIANHTKAAHDALGINADTVDNYHASSFSLVGHTHDDRYYTETELNTSGGGGAVHWNNVTNKPSTYTPSSHTHPGSDITSQVSDSDKLDGYHASSFASVSHSHGYSDLPYSGQGITIQGNFGQWQPHSTYTDFNTQPSYWGWNFVQGYANGPSSASEQWYRAVISLGSGYGLGSYFLELAFPRYNHSSAGVWMRTKEGGTLGGWTRIDGYRSHTHSGGEITSQVSDSDKVDGYHASSFAQASHTHDDRYYTETELNTSGAGGQVHWNNVTNKPSTYTPSSHTHPGSDITSQVSDSDKVDNYHASDLVAIAYRRTWFLC